MLIQYTEPVHNTGLNINKMPDFNPTQTGKRPDGQSYPIPISGTVFRTSTPLTAPNVTPTNKAATPIFSTEGFSGMGFIFNSDQPGYYTIEYFMDDQGLSLVVPMITVDYKGGDVRVRRKGAIDPDGQFARITFYNIGTAAQTVFFMAVVLKVTPFQPSLEILGAQGADSRFAMWCKSFIHIKDKDGAYGDVNRTGDALNTYVVNQSTDYAKEGTDSSNAPPLYSGASGSRGILSSLWQLFQNGFARFRIVDGNNQPVTITSGAISVTSTNPTAATDVSALNKETTQGLLLAQLQALVGKDFATQATLALVLTQLQGINADQGTPADAAVTDPTATAGEIALLKGLLKLTQSVVNRPPTGVPTTVTIGAGSTTLLAANANRKGATFTSTTTFYVGLFSGCTATVLTTRVSANGYYEVPFGYTGIITGFGSGAIVNVTELI